LEIKRSGFFDAGFFRDLAITSLIFFFVSLTPVLGAIFIIFIPLPILYYYLKDSRVKGVAILATSLTGSLVVLAIVNAYANVLLIIMLAAAGIMISECRKRNFSLEKTISYSVAAIFCLGAMFVLQQSYYWSTAPWQLVETYIQKQILYSIKVYAGLDIAAEQISMIKENITEVVSSITLILPSLFLVTVTFIVWVNLLAGRVLFRKLELPGMDFGDLSSWKAPDKMVWYLIAAGAMVLLSDERTAFIGWNMLLVILSVYLLAGLAIVSFFLKKSPLPTGFRYLFYFLIFAQQIATLLVVAAGLFDLWADFRKLNKPMENSAV
jgi:uncharacterized protein YybS (DUF2232 family)